MTSRRKTQAIAFSGIAAALCVVLLYFGSIIDVLDYTVSAFGGIIITVVLAEFGKSAAIGVWISSSALALLLIPSKISALLFVSFCGWYPMVKRALEALPRIFSIILKALIFNVILAVIFLVTVKVFMIEGIGIATAAGVFLLSNAVFVIYDILISRITALYILRLRKKLTFLK